MCIQQVEAMDKKGEEGWGRLCEPRRAASHPMVLLMKFEGVSWVDPMMCSAFNAEARGQEPGVTSMDGSMLVKDDETWWA